MRAELESKLKLEEPSGEHARGSQPRRGSASFTQAQINNLQIANDGLEYRSRMTVSTLCAT